MRRTRYLVVFTPLMCSLLNSKILTKQAQTGACK
jgi:hypothetical protein